MGEDVWEQRHFPIPGFPFHTLNIAQINTLLSEGSAIPFGHCSALWTVKCTEVLPMHCGL